MSSTNFMNFGYLTDGTKEYVAEYGIFLARWGIQTIYFFDMTKKEGHQYVLFGDNEAYLKLIDDKLFIMEEEQIVRLLNSIDDLEYCLQIADETNQSLIKENNMLLGLDQINL